ncbi:MAG TPA: YbaB/EbfC family nucleoid-associated protein [Caulobacteraceae bacterium]
MKDLGSLMKQAQAMQQKLQEAQARMAESEVDGVSGGGVVRLTLRGSGEIARLTIEESLIQPGEGEIIADLIIAAHSDAKRKLDESQASMMRDVAGPLAGLPGMPKF